MYLVYISISIYLVYSFKNWEGFHLRVSESLENFRWRLEWDFYWFVEILKILTLKKLQF